MPSLPDLPFTLPHDFLAPLLTWFSNYVYTFLRRRDAQDEWLLLEQVLDFTPLEAACSHYHKHTKGVAHTVPRLCRALFVKSYCGLSLRQTEKQLRYDIRCKSFAGYALHEAGPDHTTIDRFELYVMHNHPRLYFDTFLRQSDALTGWESHKQTQYADTFAMRASAAAESVIELLRHGCRILLTQPENGKLSAQIDTVQLFGASDEKHWCRMTAAERTALRLNTVRSTLTLLAALRETGCMTKESGRWVGCLDKVLADEFALEHDADGQLVAVRVLSKKERGSYRIASMTDPDATFRVHGKDKIDLGYNVSVAADDTFIREIRADTGSTNDATPLPDLLLAQQAHHACLPQQIVYDRAAGNAKTLGTVDRATDGKTQLVVQMVDHSPPNGQFGPRDFQLADGFCTLTCPNAVTTHTAYRSGSADGWTFRFSQAQCTDCPLMQQCGRPPERKYRQVFISDYRPLADVLKQFAETPLFGFLIRSRSFIERIIAGLVRYNDARAARRRGLKAADFQVKMAAMAFNVKTLLRVLRSRGGVGLNAA